MKAERGWKCEACAERSDAQFRAEMHRAAVARTKAHYQLELANLKLDHYTEQSKMRETP